MSDTSEKKGSCLCGAVKVTAKKVSKSVGACHCTMCRKWGGGPLLTVDCGSDISLEGKENLSVFYSSEWAERGFCSKCGTHVFYRLKPNNQYSVPVGLFDNAAGVAFDHQIFIDEKPAFYSFANETKNMTGEEVFAFFAATEKKAKS